MFIEQKRLRKKVVDSVNGWTSIYSINLDDLVTYFYSHFSFSEREVAIKYIALLAENALEENAQFISDEHIPRFDHCPYSNTLLEGGENIFTLTFAARLAFACAVFDIKYAKPLLEKLQSIRMPMEKLNKFGYVLEEHRPDAINELHSLYAYQVILRHANDKKDILAAKMMRDQSAYILGGLMQDLVNARASRSGYELQIARCKEYREDTYDSAPSNIQRLIVEGISNEISIYQKTSVRVTFDSDWSNPQERICLNFYEQKKILSNYAPSLNRLRKISYVMADIGMESARDVLTELAEKYETSQSLKVMREVPPHLTISDALERIKKEEFLLRRLAEVKITDSGDLTAMQNIRRDYFADDSIDREDKLRKSYAKQGRRILYNKTMARIKEMAASNLSSSFLAEQKKQLLRSMRLAIKNFPECNEDLSYRFNSEDEYLRIVRKIINSTTAGVNIQSKAALLYLPEIYDSVDLKSLYNYLSSLGSSNKDSRNFQTYEAVSNILESKINKS